MWQRKIGRAANLTILSQVGSPKELVERARKEKKERTRERKDEAQYEIWCVGDVDVHSWLDEALKSAQDLGAFYALSSPCLEFWFLIHFTDHRANISIPNVQKVAQTQLNVTGKNLDSDALDALFSNTDAAIGRAKSLEGNHQINGNSVYENPSSSIYKLVERLKSHL